MIVKKLWITRTQDKRNPYYKYRLVIRTWRGWFLFGIIPLYVENTHTSYEGD